MATLLVGIVIVVMVLAGIFLLLAWADTEVTNARPEPFMDRRKRGNWAVELTTPGRRRMKVVQLVREATGLGLIESKALVDESPTIMIRDIDRDGAEELVARLQTLGAEAVALPTAEIAPHSS